MIKVGWPTSNISTKAQIWRILDLSGMTKSVRESRNFTKAGFVYLDGNKVNSIKDTVELGKIFTLELIFPNNVVKSQEIMLVPDNRVLHLRPRQSSAFTRYHKG